MGHDDTLDFWGIASRFRRMRLVQNGLTFGLVFMGPLLASVTYLALGQLNLRAESNLLRVILLVDLVYILVVITLVMARIFRMVGDRRAQSAGARLHLRLTFVFAFIALTPTILVAIFGVLTVNIGLEGWFSDRVRGVVGSSLEAAVAYEGEQQAALSEDVIALSSYLDLQKQASFFTTDGALRPILAEAQGLVQRGLKEVYIIDGSGEIRVRGEKSYLFDYERPLADDFAVAEKGEVAIFMDLPQNEMRALRKLGAFPDRYLSVSRTVDGRLLALLDETKETVAVYQQLEAERGKILFNFGLLYLGFAFLLILAAIWLGLWFAERLSRPVGRLVNAVELVSGGDFSARVPELADDDEIGTLGRAFNNMTRELEGQRAQLVETHAVTEERRRLFDSVLSNVSAGVMGLDPEGRIDFSNPAARKLLDLVPGHEGQGIEDVVPEFIGLFQRLRASVGAVQEELRLVRRGKQESLLVRMSPRFSEQGGNLGCVLSFDDVTELVSAQRTAAWGDVARRIAHEIKNPLTPIQLSAERIKRKYRSEVSTPDDLDQYTSVIVRQTNDLRRIVDEFSRFARMPEPDRKENDIIALLKAAVLLQENGQPEVKFTSQIPKIALMMVIDGTMIGQALTNLIKNAGEAIESHMEKSPAEDFVPEIRVTLQINDADIDIMIDDNGSGLPPDRSRLFEPYVTTRDKGTGLGLSIVKKIVEEHNGTLALLDAPIFEHNGHVGARALIKLPLPKTAGMPKNATATSDPKSETGKQ